MQPLPLDVRLSNAEMSRKNGKFVLFGALIGFVLLGAFLGFSPSAPTVVDKVKKTENAKDLQKDNAPKKENEKLSRGVLKLIPDQKALVGTPVTVIDLVKAFQETAFAKENKNLKWMVIFNKDTKLKGKKYVDAQIEGNSLVLKWGKTGKTDIIIRCYNEDYDKDSKTPDHKTYLDCKFHAKIWQADFWKLAFAVIGGLGIFLLGMKNMSDGLQAIAGQGLRRMIALVTDNRIMATGAGVVATMVVQSSSITTVMVVGFVNSGFMVLSQAIGVIMGANIGTTITGWVLVLKIGKYGLPMLGIGIFVYLFFPKNEKIRFFALFFTGLGMVFFGLETMKDGFVMVKNLPEFEALFNKFDASTYFGVLQCAAVGCLLTFLVQSSSATLAITIGLAQINVIHFDTAAALVLGENIGTTITAWLASFGTTTNAKRAAYFHVLFNLIGVAWITAVFSWYLPIIKSIVGTDPVTGEIAHITTGIAAVHTGFNVANTLMFLPFSAMIANLLVKVIPDKPHKEKPHLTSLDVRMLETPAIAIEQSRVEILRMADGCQKMMVWLKELTSTDEEPDPAIVQKLFHREEVLDTVQDEVVSFMTHLLSANVPQSVIEEGRTQLRMADEYESISDYITSILKFHLKLRNQGHAFDEKHRKDILQLHDMVNQYLTVIVNGYENRQPEIITKANSMGAEITHLAKDLRDRHLDQLSKEKTEPYINVAYMATLNSYRRVRDHAKNIAEALAGEK